MPVPTIPEVLWFTTGKSAVSCRLESDVPADDILASIRMSITLSPSLKRVLKRFYRDGAVEPK